MLSCNDKGSSSKQNTSTASTLKSLKAFLKARASISTGHRPWYKFGSSAGGCQECNWWGLTSNTLNAYTFEGFWWFNSISRKGPQSLGSYSACVTNRRREAEGWHVMHTDNRPWFSFWAAFTTFSAITSQNNRETAKYLSRGLYAFKHSALHLTDPRTGRTPECTAPYCSLNLLNLEHLKGGTE